mgnify:CR=1 FL=1
MNRLLIQALSLTKKKYDLSLFKRQIQKEYANRVSLEMKKDLELAFEYFVDNIDSPYIISQIQYKDDESSNVYLIAKEPSKDTYYGIMEGPYISKKQIASFPEVNITHSLFKEVAIKPFLARPFIESGVK